MPSKSNSAAWFNKEDGPNGDRGLRLSCELI